MLIWSFQGVGQNLYIKGGSKVNFSRAITAFYDEVLLFNNADVKKYQFNMDTGHYTQVRDVLETILFRASL